MSNIKTYPNCTVVDLFCGVGGLTHGFVKEKFSVAAGIDFDSTCEYPYEKNNRTKFIHADLTKYSSEEIRSLFPEGHIKVLVGCAPCQAFSNYSQGNKKNDKWKLLYAFGKIIREVAPDVISMENVPQLEKYEGGKVFKDFLRVLDDLKYKVSYSIVQTQKYGVPQSRSRLVLFASKLGEIKIIDQTHRKRYVTVRKAIGKLPPIKAGEVHSKDSLHRARQLTPINKQRIRATPEGGGWKNWPSRLVLDCHKKKSGKSYGSVYGRMKWDDVAPTLTTQCTGYGNGRYGHPEQDRAISLREAAILQSFPKGYKFPPLDDTLSHSDIERHIGNAVPVRLGRVIAKSIRNHLQDHGH